MAIDSTFLPVINEALNKLGQKRLVASQLTTPNTKNARVVDDTFQNHLEKLIDDHPWGFAITRVQLTTPSVPVYGYDWAYPFPDGVLYSAAPYCIRMLEVGDQNLWIWGYPGFWNGWYANPVLRWKSESRELLIDAGEPLDCRYLYLPTVATLMPPNFKECLSLKLAMEWAEQITATQTLDEKIERRYEKVVMEARSIDSQEGIPDPLQSTTWIDGRWT